jgi:hypothetical protein
LVPSFSNAPAAKDLSAEKFVLRLKRPKPVAVAVSQEDPHISESLSSSTCMPAEERASSAPPQHRTRNPVPMFLPVRQSKKANGTQNRDFIVHDLVPPMTIPTVKSSPYPIDLLADDNYAELRKQRNVPTPFMEPLTSHQDGSGQNSLSAAEVFSAWSTRLLRAFRRIPWIPLLGRRRFLLPADPVASWSPTC